MKVIYVHGFASGPESSKFRYLQELDGVDAYLFRAEYDTTSLEELAADLIDMWATVEDNPILVGHSLGGFLVRYACRRLPASAILINPSFFPQDTLGRKVHHVSDYTVDKIDWRLNIDRELSPETVLVECGDDVVDWKRQIRLNGASRTIYTPKGSHSFERLEDIGRELERINNMPWHG